MFTHLFNSVSQTACAHEQAAAGRAAYTEASKLLQMTSAVL